MVDHEYSELFWKDSVDKQWKIEYDGGVITNEILFSQSIELTESLCSESNLRFGSCETSVFKFKVANILRPLINNWLRVSVTLNNQTDSLFIVGKFKVISDKPTSDRMHREIIAYDIMHDILNADATEWYNLVLPSNSGTITLKQFRESFIRNFGITETVPKNGLINDNMTVERTIEAEQISGKDIITAICEVNGCFGHIGRDGKFHYIYLTQDMMGLYPSDTLFPDHAPEYLPQSETGHLYPQCPSSSRIGKSNYIKCQWEDFITKRITKLQIRQKENDIGKVWPEGELNPEDNCYIIEDNFLMYGKSNEQLSIIAENIFNKITNIVYRPFNCDAVGNLCFEVGDAIRIPTKYEIVESYVLERTLKGVQALRDSYKSSGSETYAEKVNGVQKSIIQLKGKTNALERTIEKTESTIANNSTDWYEGDIEIDLYGYGPPEKNYRAGSDYVNKNYLDRETGTYYQCREGGNSENPYRWQEIGKLEKAQKAFESKITQTAKDITSTVSENYQTIDGMAKYPTMEKAQSMIKQEADSITSTVSKSQKIWDISDYDESKLLYGYGYPNKILYKPSENLDKKYLDQSSGEIYEVENGVWTKKRELPLITQELNTKIEQTEEGIASKVSKSRTVWNTEGINIDLYGWGPPEELYDALDYPYKYYLDQSSGKLYLSIASGTEYRWSAPKQLKETSQDFSTNITQLSDEIILKVNVGDVSNQVSIEKNGVIINSNRLHVNSDNFKLNGAGEVEAAGMFTTGDEKNYVELNGNALRFYANASLSGQMVGSYRSDGQSVVHLNSGGYGIDFGFIDDSGLSRKYLINNGAAPNIDHRHIFYDSAKFYDGVFADELVLGNELYVQKVEVAGMEVLKIDAPQTTIIGDFSVTGQKNRVVTTKNFGDVKLNAFETAGAYFSDIGSGKIKDGACYVYFDPVFAETIELNADYQVFLTRTSIEKTEYVEKKRGYFIVFGEDGATFDWMTVAKQKDYSMIRMEQSEIQEREETYGENSFFYGDDVAPAQSIAYSEELNTDAAKEAFEYFENYSREESFTLEGEE